MPIPVEASRRPVVVPTVNTSHRGWGTPSRRRALNLCSLLALVILTIGAAVGADSIASAGMSTPFDAPAAAQGRAAVTPIRHVVVIFQENHSFDNVLGGLCVTDHLRCDGTTTGVLHSGQRIVLSQAHDIVAQADHSAPIQGTDINHGRMDGFDLMHGCTAYDHYACYTQYSAREIPSLRKLAEKYVISDRTFSQNPVPSWGGHVDLIAGQLDGFAGLNPTPNPKVAPRPGWGCDSRKDSPWRDPAKPFAGFVAVPSCIPRVDGYGPYRASPVKHVDTILDRLSVAGLSWKLYADTSPSESGYIWSICPSFASCLHDPNNHNRPDRNWKKRTAFRGDAGAGRLPSYSVVLPSYALSQHNTASMLQGDNYIESLVKAVEDGPEWRSTVIFITYDDCGCFYDHVPPPAGSGLGIRVPMLIVSPRVKRSYVDHTVASFDSMLAFVEKNWRLAPLGAADAHAYDYCHSFVFTTLPCTGAASGIPNVTGPAAPAHIALQPSPVPRASIEYETAHPPDLNDPT